MIEVSDSFSKKDEDGFVSSMEQFYFIQNAI